MTLDGKAADAKTVGDELNDLKDDLNDVLDELITTNMNTVTVEKTSDVFSLYGNRGYLSYTDGHFVASDTNAIYIFDIDHDDQIYITKVSGGQVGAVLFDEHLDTIPTSASAASAHFLKGARSDKTGDNALPTSGTPWTVQTGQMLAIFIQTAIETSFEMTFHEPEMLLGDSVHLNTTQITEVENALISMGYKKPVIKYSAIVDTDIGSRGKEQITVYIPATYGYIKYAFVRCEYDAYNSNVWRIDRCYACDDTKNVIYPITNVGEWEMAIKIVGAPDFIGGNAHGDEVYAAFHVLIDGVEQANIQDITEREFDFVNIIETSLLYNPSNHATLSTREQYTPVGSHGREYIITKDGIRLKQVVKLDIALTLSASYMTMLPILRGNDAVSEIQVTDHYYADNNFVEYDVSVGGKGDGYGWKPNVKRAVIWGNTSGISASVEMLAQPDIDNIGARLFQVQSTVNAYNKLYWSICGVGGNENDPDDPANYSASENERFVTDTRYHIDAKHMP